MYKISGYEPGGKSSILKNQARRVRVFLWKDRMKTIKQSDGDGAAGAGFPGEAIPAAPGKAAEASDVIGTDEHSGKGGSFVFDPATGLRSPNKGNE